ncbi:thiamine diphosphate-binding protein [Pyronema omphalodes]|nr:thiamine diphosphate-binding protein [Pyronema omphalodes]
MVYGVCRALQRRNSSPRTQNYTPHRFLSTTAAHHVNNSTNSIRQPPSSDSVSFPGAVKSKFTHKLEFHRPQDMPAMNTYRYINAEGVVVDTDRKLDIGKDMARKMYKDMVRTSIMDLIMYDSQRQGRISFYMVSAGEEGIAVGSAAALEPEDVLYSQYREQGALMYRGYTLDEFMSQLFASKDDYGKGRNMPVHYMSEKLHLHPISSTLATQIPHAVGAAYAMKLENAQSVVACYFGEGAASEGDFHAALNIAATRDCPVVFICRNNGYAISTPTLEQYKGDGIASRGIGYGIETIRVDGNDIMAVYAVTKAARELASKNQKPVLIEAMSYRVSHHSTSDDSFAYRAKVDVEEWKRRDNPITRFRKWLEAKEWWSDDEEVAFRTQARKDVLTAFAKAEKAKKPPLGDIFTDVFAEMTPELKEQRAQLKAILEEYPDEYELGEFDNSRL